MPHTPEKKPGPGEDIRSLLKKNHKKIYLVCRLFANNYQEHRILFARILAAASQNMQNSKTEKVKYVLFLRACINMAALHSISNGLFPVKSNEDGQYKSPDYQKSMDQLRKEIQGASDAEKIQLFLNAENVITDEIVSPEKPVGRQNKGSEEKHNRRFIPFIKEKLIWS